MAWRKRKRVVTAWRRNGINITWRNHGAAASRWRGIKQTLARIAKHENHKAAWHGSSVGAPRRIISA